MRIPNRFRILGLIILAVVFLNAVGALTPLERLLVGTAGLVSRAFAPLRTWHKERVDGEEAQKKLTAFQERITELEAENTRLFSENEAIRAKLKHDDFLAATRLRGIFSSVLGRNPEGGDQMYILNRGSNDGIAIGMSVVNEDGILLGTIRETNPSTSSLLLPTAALSAIGVEVQNSSKSKGIMEGEHGLSLIVNLVPVEEPIEINQRVVTSALDDNIPPGIFVGTISEIRKEPGGLFQTAVVKPAMRYENLRSATIMLPPQ